MANAVSHSALPFPVKGCRFTIPVPYLDADGDPTDPTTPDTERSIDGAAFADCTEEVTTITGSNGTGYITLTGDEMNGSLIAVAAKVASGPKATLEYLQPRVLPVIFSGTATAGAAGTITLSATNPPLADDLIIGCIIRTTGGTGGGGGSGSLNNQARVITDYVASTRVVSVTPNWETNPSSDTTYEVLLTDSALIRYADLRLWLGVVPLALLSQYVQVDVGSMDASVLSNAAFHPDTGLKSIRSGIAQAGAASSITLDAGASATNDFYKGARIYLTSGTGAGQSRLCTAYNGSTKVASIEPDWTTNPSVTTNFAIRDQSSPLTIPTGAISSASFASGAVNAAAIGADAITAAKVADGTIDAATFAAGAINAAAIADGAIDDAAVAADMDAYHAKVWVIRESTTTDHYAVIFFKNGQPVTSGITSPTIQVIKASDGTDLIASTALTEVGSLGIYKKDESTNKLISGAIYFAKVQATIDGSTRSWLQQVGRDSA